METEPLSGNHILLQCIETIFLVVPQSAHLPSSSLWLQVRRVTGWIFSLFLLAASFHCSLQCTASGAIAWQLICSPMSQHKTSHHLEDCKNLSQDISVICTLTGKPLYWIYKENIWRLKPQVMLSYTRQERQLSRQQQYAKHANT